MTFRSGIWDFSPHEAKRMYQVLSKFAEHWDGETIPSVNTQHLREARDLVQEFRGRVRYLPANLPTEFVLVHAPTPIGGDFDDWMQRHRDHGEAHRFPYASYGAHPRRHLASWVGGLDHGSGVYAYFVPHRKAKQQFSARETRAPFMLHYDFACPLFQTIDLSCLEISRGPYAGQRLHLLFDEPGVFLVKQTYSMQKYEHRRSVVYATWCAHLAPPYGTWRKHVR